MVKNRKEFNDLLQGAIQSPVDEFVDYVEGEVVEARDLLENALNTSRVLPEDVLVVVDSVLGEVEEALGVLKRLVEFVY